MNLNKGFNNIKGKQYSKFQFKLFLSDVGNFIAGLGVAWLMNWGWNYIAPVWGLPELNYGQFLTTLVLIFLLKHFFGFTATNGNVHPNVLSIKDILGEHLHEEK